VNHLVAVVKYTENVVLALDVLEVDFFFNQCILAVVTCWTDEEVVFCYVVVL